MGFNAEYLRSNSITQSLQGIWGLRWEDEWLGVPGAECDRQLNLLLQ